MCKEYIEREAVNALIKAECSPKVAAYLIDAVATIPAADVVERASGIIGVIPAADVRPVVRGKWKTYNNTYVCSACGRPVSFWQSNFCPNCGADMREGGR